MDKKIEELELRIKELEGKINKSNTMFGRSYSLIGSSNSDFLINTRGLVKIQWGSKIIDLIKDGKINCDSKYIFSVKSKDNIGSKDGIYYIQDTLEVWLKFSSDIIHLATDSESTYVSYEELELTDQQKLLALINIGLVCASSNIPLIQNGFIYVSDEDLFYIVHDGTMSKISSDFPNPLKVLLRIDLNGTLLGSLIISGTGKENGINFGTSWIYDNNGVVVDSPSKIEFKINSLNSLIVLNDGIKTPSIESDLIQSNNFKIHQGILYCDHVEERNPSTAINSNTTIYFSKALISLCDKTDLENVYMLTLSKNVFKVGDIVVILTDYELEEESIIVNLYIGEIILGEESINDNVVYFQLNKINLSDVDFYLDINDLKGKYIYLYLRDNLNALIINNNSIYLGTNLLIGYDKNDTFIALYPIALLLPLNDSSFKFATTEWVQRFVTSELSKFKDSLT